MSREAAVVATHVLVFREGQVLLLRRANTGYQDGNYSVPAGHVERGEHPAATGARELEEETGLLVSEADLSLALVMHRFAETPRVDFFFALERWSGEPRNCEPGKCDDLHWAPLEDLPLNMVPYVRHAILAYRDGRAYAEFTDPASLPDGVS